MPWCFGFVLHENLLEKVGRFQCHSHFAETEIQPGNTKGAQHTHNTQRGYLESCQKAQAATKESEQKRREKILAMRVINNKNFVSFPPQQQSQYTTLYYLETSPTYCSVTKDRQCLNQDNCANLCCGRGYVTRVFKQVEKCRCRFNNGRCCQLICDYCQRYEDRYFCKQIDYYF